MVDVPIGGGHIEKAKAELLELLGKYHWKNIVLSEPGPGEVLL